MSDRSTPFHSSLHRPRLIMGLEKGAFGAIALLAAFALVVQAAWMFVLVVVGYLVAKWLSKKDDQFFAIFIRFLQEDHVFDSIPRPSDSVSRRPKGWGKGLPK